MSVGYADPIAEANVAIKSRTDGGAHVLARDIERLPGTVETDIGASKSFLETLAGIVVTGRAAVDLSGTVQGYLQSLASAIAAARMQTDVATLPGTVAADIATLASAIATGSMKAVLQASSNVIGKLAANVGVNIGTVDVASMPAVTGTVDVGSMPAVSGTVSVDSLPAVTGTVDVSQLPSALGQAAMAASLPVAIASDQPAVPISVAALPLPASAAQEHATAVSPHASRLTDGAAFYDATKTGQLPAALGQAAAAGSLSVALASDQASAATPLRVDPTGSTTQPVSAASLPLPSNAAQEHVTAASPHAARLSDGSAFYDAAKTAQLPGALGQTTKSASVSVTLASDQDAASTSAVTSVAAATSSTTLLAANANRLGFSVYNGGNADMYLKLGSSATSSSHSAVLVPGGYYEPPCKYTGIVTAAWVTTGGSARVTELT